MEWVHSGCCATHSVGMHLRGDIVSCAYNEPRLEFNAASPLLRHLLTNLIACVLKKRGCGAVAWTVPILCDCLQVFMHAPKDTSAGGLAGKYSSI